MEEVYTLWDGSTVDISDYSQFEKTNFLIKNPGAKKSKGGANSAVAAPKSKQAQNQNADSKSVNGSSVSQKFRLPTTDELDKDLINSQKKGLVPPPSETAKLKAVPRRSTIEDLYNIKTNYSKGTVSEIKDDETKLSFDGKKKEQKIKYKTTYGKDIVDDLIESIDNPNNIKNKRRDLQYDIDYTKHRIEATDSNLLHPYLYYSSQNKGQPDDFVSKNYNAKELQTVGVNIDDFDGFLNKKGYKDDFLNKEAEGIYEGTGNATFARYDIGLAKELAKKKMLNMYMEDMQQRDFTRQDLNQDLEIASGFRKEKQIVHNDIFDPNGIPKYVEKNFPIITQKLKERDIENKKIYYESKKGGTDFFSWETLSKMGKSGWNAITDRTKQISAATYSAIGMEATAEGVRALDEENKFIRPDDRGMSYASGKTVSYKGTDYLVDSKGEIYDKDAKIRVTDLFDESEYKNIVETSKYGPSDWIFSTQGAAVQTSGVMADMLMQAAVTHGVGEFGAIASEARVALNGARQTSKFTSLLNDTSQLLRKIPLDRAEGYSMIAQGALGYSQGYEDTLKAARDNGINDTEALKLASSAAQRMAVLYSTTGIINPQTNVAENIFGSKKIIKEAINQYLKVGEKGFVNYIDNVIKNTPRNLIEFAEHGGAEVVQENIQQVSELGVNKLTNQQAGKKLMNDIMSGDDFMNTSVLSFISSGLISKIKIPNLKNILTPKSEALDDLTSLSTLAKNKKEFTKIVDGLVDSKVFTKDQVDKLKSDVDTYSNNINKIPKSISAETAMPIMKELDKITKLQNEKEGVAKVFHPNIDLKIEEINKNIEKIIVTDKFEKQNKAIDLAIKKGIVENIEKRHFSTTQELEDHLVNVIGMPRNVAKEQAKRQGNILDEQNLKYYAEDPSTITKGQTLILVNDSVSIGDKNAGVSGHEFGHGIISKTIARSPQAQILLGSALSKELVKLRDKASLEGKGQTPTPDSFIQRINQYTEMYDIKINEANEALKNKEISAEEHNAKINTYVGNNWEEVMMLYSDAVNNGTAKYDEGIMVKLGDTIRRVLQYLGLKDIKFESGRDVYNFIKDYNHSVETGKWGVAMKKLGTKGAKINKEKLSKEVYDTGFENAEPVKGEETKASLGEDKKSSEQIQKDVNAYYNKDTFAKKINSERDATVFDIISEYSPMIKAKARALGFTSLPGYDPKHLDMLHEMTIQLIPHIRNFNKEFLQKRDEYKKELESKGLNPDSKEFKDKVVAQDEKGYPGKKGLVKENNNLNGWINSQLVNKMNAAMGTGRVAEKKFLQDIEGEMFKETSIVSGFGGDEGYLMDEGERVEDIQSDFEQEQNKLAVLLNDPVFRFVDQDNKPVLIETVPFGGRHVISSSDPTIAANIKLRTETDPEEIAKLNKQLSDLERGLELQYKDDITSEEKDELKRLRSFQSFDLSSGMLLNTFEALSIKDSPARIMVDEVSREILSAPNIATLEYKNFKKRLADQSMVMMKRVTFEAGPGLESFMYNNWKLIYDVINHPVDVVTGESSYTSKKLPPRLKEFDDNGNLRKIGDITRVKFLQSFYGIDEATRIIKENAGDKAESEINKFEDEELSEVTGGKLWHTAYFDRRTALRELFGDVMVLQEARRLIRDNDFLEKIKDRNVNLYNDLKDDKIRAEVLQNMSKGKSDIVKFSLQERTEDKSKTQIPNDYKSILRTGNALLQGISNNILYAPDSLPTADEDIKYSLEEVLSQKSDLMYGAKDYVGYNKKYSVHFKPTFSEDYAGVDAVTMDKNFYVKVLQYSDAVDDGFENVKLHTLKSYEEVENEVVKRVKELLENITLQPAYGTIASYQKEIDMGTRTQLPIINPYLIDDYRDGYIEAMLEKSIRDNDQEYIDLWTRIKESEVAKQDYLYKIKLDQKDYLDNLSRIFMVTYSGFGVRTADSYHNGIKFKDQKTGVDKINEISSVKVTEPNNLKFNPFFAYLFLKDVLSNRYKLDANKETVERKPFKKSEYRNTEQPIADYKEELIEKVYEGFSHVELKNPALIYGYLFLEKNRSYNKDWVNNRDATDFENNKIFKFEKSSKEFDGNSLSALAAKNTSNTGAWCTGRSAPLASQQLSKGQFFIAANKEYIPVAAIRFDQTVRNGIGEVVGTNSDQTFKLKDLPLISKMFELSNLDEKDRFVRLTNSLYELLTSNNQDTFKNNTYEENTVLIQDLRRIVRGSLFRFQLELKEKQKVPKLLKDTKNNLVALGLIDPTITETVKDIIDENGEILLQKDNVDILEDEVEITLNSLETEHDETINIAVEDDEKVDYKLPLLETIDYIQFNGASNFVAPQLTDGEELFLNGFYGNEQEGSAYLELPRSINYNVSVDLVVNISDSENNGVLISAEPISFKQDDHREFTIRTDFINQTNSYIDASMLEDLKSVIVSGHAQTIMLSKDDLGYLGIHGMRDQLNPDFTEIFGPKNIKTFSTGISKNDVIIQNIFFEEGTKINKTVIDLKETPDDDLIKIILTSNLGLKSENIKLAISQYQNNGRINYYELDIKSKNKKEGDSETKASLAEDFNAKLSPFMSKLGLTEQFFVARTIDKAIAKSKNATGETIESEKIRKKIEKETDPVKIKELKEELYKVQQGRVIFKVPSMSKMSDKATAFFIIDKVAQGYNHFEFKVKKNADGLLTRQVLDALDFQRKSYQDRMKRNGNLEKAMNDIIAENKGVESDETYSPETAKNIGKNIGKGKIFLPPEDEDFEGLMYTLASASGKKGEEQIRFFRENLIQPYSDAMLNLMKARQRMYADWTQLINKKYKGISKTLKKDSGYGNYVIDQAVRVYLWEKAGYPIPGLDKKDLFHLLSVVRNDPRLRDFAEDVSLLSKQANGYVEPGHNWGYGSVVSDINNIISKSNRNKYLERWQSNVDKIFSKDNLSKIEAVYGSKYVRALNNTLDRMKTGTNRAAGSSNAVLNYLNGATAVTMFLNTRSSILQLLGAVNYINATDNNIFKAGKALLDVKQYSKDVMTIWNSDYSRDRRSGLMNDVAEAELAQLMNDPRNANPLDKLKAANYWVLKQGFVGTRVMDSLAIALGGAAFYRNRLNTYLASNMEEMDAKKATMRDFYELSEKTQQSADVSKISMNQASALGRVFMSFLNTPFQYSRLIKRSVIDLVKGRGSVPNNLGKIVYYGAVQNIMFNYLQNALFALAWDDEDEQKKAKYDTAKYRVIWGSLDTLLKGTGFTGVILSGISAAVRKWYEKHGDPKAGGDVLLEISNLSPPIGIKARAVMNAYKTVEYNWDEIEQSGFYINNPYSLQALASLTSATTNVPFDRIYQKIENVRGALDKENTTFQRMLLLSGYNKNNLGIQEIDYAEDETNDELNDDSLNEDSVEE